LARRVESDDGSNFLLLDAFASAVFEVVAALEAEEFGVVF
jgi:hypothetical protein